MRSLERNKQEVYYATYSGKQEITDDDGNLTGEYGLVYNDPVLLRINVSAARGESATRLFGELEDYDKVLISTDTELPITKTTVFWIDNTDTEKPHDYVVRKVAKGLNSIQIAVRKVDVSEDEAILDPPSNGDDDAED